MLKTVSLVALAVILAVGGGVASAWLMIDGATGFATVSVGPWTAHPERGTPDADPYSKARFARDGDLALGQAEGLSFHATRDSAGQPLIGKCAYVIEGDMPPARFWTLHAAARATNANGPVADRQAAIHSMAILRREDNSFDIAVSRDPAPGNWLRTRVDGPIELVLTLYDTPIATGARVADVALPQILRARCVD